MRKFDITEEKNLEKAVENLISEVGADDIYAHLAVFVDGFSALIHELYEKDPLLYTELCFNEENLYFLNMLARYEIIVKDL